jgi:hypothetical protein
LLLAAAILCTLMVRPALAQERFLGGAVDLAGVLGPDDRKALGEAAEKLGQLIRSDLFVVTVDDTAEHWADLRKHRKMLDEAFRRVESARQRHYGQRGELTLVVLYKSHPVMHLKSSSADVGGPSRRVDSGTAQTSGLGLHACQLTIAQALFGKRSSYSIMSVRAEAQSHAEAGLRYLGYLERLAEERAITKEPAAQSIGQFWRTLCNNVGVVVSSVAWPQLSSMFSAYLQVIGGAINATWLLPGWVAFLLYFCLTHATLEAGSRALKALIGPGGASLNRWLCKGLLAAAPWLLLVPPLALLFAVANLDFDALFRFQEEFGGELSQYVSWSEGVQTHNFAFERAGKLVAAALVIGLEMLRWGRTPAASAAEGAGSFASSALPMFTGVASGLALIFCLHFFPGYVAVYFVVFLVLVRVAAVLRSTATGSKRASDRHPSAAAPRAAPALRQS